MDKTITPRKKNKQDKVIDSLVEIQKMTLSDKVDDMSKNDLFDLLHQIREKVWATMDLVKQIK